ncbi:MAG: septum formation initiator family protein [Flavobacteriales bacterium]|nr:septum formation initiator family protein [Flavobacteriales bacterium]
MLEKIPNWLKNKYILTLVLFLVWMMFFNDIDLIYVLENRSELSDLRDQRDMLEKASVIAEEDLYNLLTNQETLERFARETYLMKRDNEDIFLFRERIIEN